MESTLSPDRGTSQAELIARVALSLLPGLGDRGVARVVDRFGSARRALAVDPTAFRAVAGTTAAEGRSQSDVMARARRVLETAEHRGLDVLTPNDPGYPSRLHTLHDPPAVLFTTGDRSLFERPAVAIVGARRATEAGRRVAEHLAATVARAGAVVVSGMALGIDGAAHRGALSVGGPTIAVLGSGADRPTPMAHASMYRRIRANGLVVSEFPPGTPARPHAFPRRNRIIAALTKAVVVVEAARRSGALITVDHALDLGRDVFAVPGSVEASQSEGTNALIRDGARILLEPNQLLDELALPRSLSPAGGPAPPGNVDPSARKVWSALSTEPRHVDVLAREAGLDTARALAALTELETVGRALQLPGMRYARADGSGGGQ